MGKGVKQAVDNVNNILSDAVARANPTDLAAVDDLLWYVVISRLFAAFRSPAL